MTVTAPTSSRPLSPQMLSGLCAALLNLAISVFLAVSTSSLLLLGAPFDELFAANSLSKSLRAAGLVLGLVAAALVGSLLYWKTKSSSRQLIRLTRWAQLLSPLGCLPFVLALFSRAAWLGNEQWFLVYLLLVSLVSERLMKRSITAAQGIRQLREFRLPRLGAKNRGLVPALLTVSCLSAIVAFYFFRVGALTNIGHLKFATMSSDLAEFDNLFFNALHGHPFRSPAIEGELQNWSALKVHAEFGLYLLLPFYALSPGPEALLWIQSGLVALSAVPIFLLAQARLGRMAGLIFAFAFLMMPATQRPNFFDYHFTPLGMLLVAWLLYLLNALNDKPQSLLIRRCMWSVFALALLSREDISIGLCVLGLFLILSRRLVHEGVSILLISATYFVTVKFMIMPHFGKMWFDNIYQDLKANDYNGFPAVILTLLSNPAFVLRSLITEAKFLYLLHMIVPMLALWLRKPILWWAILPGFVSTLLVTNRAPMYQSSFQYTYLWVPYVVAASIVALPRLKTRFASLAALAIVALALGHQFGVVLGGEKILGGFNERSFEFSEEEKTRHAQLGELLQKIPPQASVAVTEREGPHVSTRLVMYSLKFGLGHKPDYLLVGEHPRIRGEADHIAQALNTGNYGVIATSGPFMLVERGAATTNNGPLWRRIGKRPQQSRQGKK